MNNETTVPLRALKALRHLCSKDESRWVITGLCVEVGKDDLKVIATDGRRLGVYREIATHTQEDRYVMPVGWLDWLPRMEVRVALSRDDRWINVTVPEQAVIRVQAMEAAYPEWRSVVPTEPFKPVRAVCFNPEYMAGFIAAAAEFGTDQVLAYAHGEETSPLSVFLPKVPEFYGLQMMIVRARFEPKVPSWAGRTAEAAAETKLERTIEDEAAKQ